MAATRAKRSASGLQLQQKVGANPYRFGFVGGSDFHDGLSTSREDAYGGNVNGIDPATTVPSQEDIEKSFAGKGLRRTALRLSQDRLGQSHGRMGRAEHARVHLRRASPQGDVRDLRPAHQAALLRRLGLQERSAEERDVDAAGATRTASPMGGDLAAKPGNCEGAEVPRLGAEGPERRESRSGAGRESVAGQGWQVRGEGLRCRPVERPQGRCRRPARLLPSATPWT